MSRRNRQDMGFLCSQRTLSHNITEQQIQKELDELAVGRTTLIIAHRLSTIRHADKIVVLDEGAVAECGSHEELLARKGHYYDLYQKG